MMWYCVCSMCQITSVISINGSPSCLRGIRCFFVSASCGPLQLSLLLRVHMTMLHLRHNSTAALISLSSCHRHHGMPIKMMILRSRFKEHFFGEAILIYFLHANSCRIKIPLPFEWGPPIFTAGHSFGMMGAVLVAAFEVTRCFSISRSVYLLFGILF